jgi:hypothetical protein
MMASLGTSKWPHLRVVGRAGCEQSIQRVVCRDEEADRVDKELGRDVEEDEEEIKEAEPKDYVDLWDICLLFKIVEDLVLGEL